MSRGFKALLIVLLGLPLVVMSCGALLSPPTAALPPAPIRGQSVAMVQTASSYQTRTPTIRELEAQATASALRWSPDVPPSATPQPPTPTAPAEPAAAPPSATPTAEPLQAAGGLSPDTVRRIDEYLANQVAAGAFSGSVLIARDGKVIFSRGYGMADSERGIANAPTTRFRLASVTKQFTSMSIMLLEADGKLKTSDPVCAYIPNCPPAWSAITLRHLLTHTSGLPNYTDFADFDATEDRPTTPDELLRRFRDLPLNFNPGEAYSYGNSGYVVLGKIIEQVSGMPYEQFVQERIFTPLGMADSGYDHDLEGTTRAVGYASAGTRADPLDCSTLYAAGALYSTVEDMYRWDQALLYGKLLPPQFEQEMLTPFLSNYGYGWKVEPVYNRPSFGHEGLISGFSTYNLNFPDDKLSVVVLSNFEITPAKAIGRTLAGMVLGAA